MKTALLLFRIIRSTLVLAAPTLSNAEILIDSFLTPQSAPGGGDTRNVAAGSGILGGERDIISYLRLSANGTVPGQLLVAYPNGALTGLAGTDITYDGVDHDPSSSYYGGLGHVDLTQGGVNDRFRFLITSVTNTSATLEIDVTSPYRSSKLQVNLPPTPGVFDLPFASFHQDPLIIFTNGVDFHDVGYINLHFEMNSGASVVIDSVVATTIPEPSTPVMICGLLAALLAIRRRPMRPRLVTTR